MGCVVCLIKYIHVFLSDFNSPFLFIHFGAGLIYGLQSVQEYQENLLEKMNVIWCVMYDLHTACPALSSTHTPSFSQRTDTHGSGGATLEELEEAGVVMLSGVTGEDEFGGFMVVEGKGCDTAR